MKKNLTTFLILLAMGFLTQAQDENLSGTLSYPITVGDNFLNEYTGYIDLGVQYRFLDLKVVQLGISVNASFVGIPNPEIEQDKFSGMLIHPRIFGEFPLGNDGRFRPIVGIGYGANKFSSTANSDGISQSTIKRTWDGLLLNFGLSYDLSERFFIIGQYDYAEIDRSSLTANNDKYNRTGNLIKIGAGFRF